MVRLVRVYLVYSWSRRIMAIGHTITPTEELTLESPYWIPSANIVTSVFLSPQSQKEIHETLPFQSISRSHKSHLYQVKIFIRLQSHLLIDCAVSTTSGWTSTHDVPGISQKDHQDWDHVDAEWSSYPNPGVQCFHCLRSDYSIADLKCFLFWNTKARC